MPHGEDCLLDHFAFNPMVAGTYYRVHPASLSDGTVIHPLSANPFSTARLAMPGRELLGKRCGMFYASDTAAGALFEALLRYATIYPGRQVYLARHRLVNQRLSVVRLVRDILVLPCALPDRKIFVTDPQRDARWRELISTPDHVDTHAAAVAVAEQLEAADVPHNGLMWPSIQVPSANVFLLYDPPLQRADWIHDETIALDTPAGEALIAQALADAGYAWLADPLGHGFTPGPNDRGVL